MDFFFLKCVPIFGKKILLKVSRDILPLIILLLYLSRNLFWDEYQYFRRFFFWKCYLTLLQLSILLLNFRRNLFCNVYQYLERRFSWKFTWYCYHWVFFTFIYGKKCIQKCVPIYILGKKILLECLLDMEKCRCCCCCHCVSYFFYPI